MLKYGIEIDHKKFQKHFYIRCLIILIIFVVMMATAPLFTGALQVKSDWHYLFVHLLRVLHHLSWMTTFLKYLFLLHTLYIRHESINILFSNRFSDSHGFVQPIAQNRIDKWELCAFIRQLGKRYEELCSIMDSTNVECSFQVQFFFCLT